MSDMLHPINSERAARFGAIDQLAKLGESDKLWEMGELHWKLNVVQRELKEMTFEDVTKTSVVVVSRRTGKTWWLLTEALEQCMKYPNSVVKFLFPQQKGCQGQHTTFNEDDHRRLSGTSET